MKEPTEEYIERGIRQAEYANHLQTVNWVLVNARTRELLSDLCDTLYEEFGIRELSEGTMQKLYYQVKSRRVFTRKGRI